MQIMEGHSGYGLYVSLAEYPEEGSELLALVPIATDITSRQFRETAPADRSAGTGA